MKINYNKPCVLSIAGFDPSGGAGVLADIKTFEASNILGFAINTCITIQNENEFQSIDWLPIEQIKKQIHILFKLYDIEVVKIGLVENLESLIIICDELLSINLAIKIIWDPILKSSTGFLFHANFEETALQSLLQKMYIITPNTNEADILFSSSHPATIQSKGFAEHAHILLKGGHLQGNDASDVLISKNDLQIIAAARIENAAKHGSGCVLSSAIASNIAHGFTVLESCKNAKTYIHQFLVSSPNLLGFHSQS